MTIRVGVAAACAAGLTAWLAGCVDRGPLARDRPTVDGGADARWDFPRFPDASGALAVRGSARLVGGVLRLADEQDGLSGAAFLLPPVPIVSEGRTDARFTFRISASTPQRSDGLVFMWQSDPRGVDARGVAGSGLGYARIAPSLAVEFDVHAMTSGADPSANHVGVVRDGDVSRHLAANPEPGIDFERAERVTVWITWDGPTQTLSVWASEADARPGAPLLTYTVDLPSVVGPSAILGLAAGTGEHPAAHEIFDLQVTHRP